MEVRRTIIIALLAALIVVGSYIAIPIGVVPITLQTMFVLWQEFWEVKQLV